MNLKLLSLSLSLSLLLTACGGQLSVFKGRREISETTGTTTNNSTASGFGVTLYDGDSPNELVIDGLLDAPISVDKQGTELTVQPGQYERTTSTSSHALSWSGKGTLEGNTLSLRLSVTSSYTGASSSTSNATIIFSGTKL